MLIVSGTGRNVGKTTFVCSLIDKLKASDCVVVKISSHFHDLPDDAVFVENNSNFQVMKELNPFTQKDSSKMLAAGASKVYYVQATDNYLEDVLRVLKLDDHHPYIFESGAIAKYLPDALHFCVSATETSKPCLVNSIQIDLKSHGADAILDSIQFKSNKFSII